ncbi:MAG: MBL fold metallo-hydrolase RNA specificity domain-containing protein [Candidatus Asgardarchaeia archaeon]
MIISGKKIKVRAKIRQIKGFSAHADQPELIEHMWRMKNKPKLTALVHGEPKALRELEKKVKREKLTKKTIIPKFGEKITLDKFFEK